jgi:hypothetical protein
MKIEQLLVQHFYITKKVTLQGIGTFTLSPDFILPADNDKEIVLPENAVSFQFNPRATEDEALIDYIVQQTRKIKPLASADLESYLTLASQFLNIGKPLKIEGIGMLEKRQNGQYFFSQGEFINTKVEEAEVKLKEKTQDDISFANEGSNASGNKKLLIGIAAVAGIALIVWAAWYFLNKKKAATASGETAVEQTSVIPPVTDTITKDTTALLQQKPDSNQIQVATVNSGGAYTFKVVIKNYPSLLPAQKAYERLSSYGHKLILYTTDSVNYKVAMPFTRPLTDTTYAKDSVRARLFGGNPYIEIK